MFTFTLTLDPALRIPMYEQLYTAIAGAIRGGALLHGEKLPSKRALCDQLGVSRATVETAYELLTAEGYVESRPRSGFYVSDYQLLPAREGQPAEIAAGSSPVCSVTQNSPANAGLTDRGVPSPQQPAESPFSTSAVDVSAFPYTSWAKLYKEVVYNSPELLQRGEPRGEPALRQALSRLLSAYRGVRCTPEQIVVGAGIETLLEQLITLFGPDTVYGVEDPGYPAIRRSLESRGRSIRFVPLDGAGMDAEALAASGASVAYLTPSHQFPLGVTMPATRRSRLLRWAAEGERWIIEDDYDSEFRYGVRPIPSMQGMDRADRVIYVGTFSRSLAPAIRLAYMVLPPALLARWQRTFGRQQPTVSRYEQNVMARFLEDGYYGRYIRRVGNLYAHRRQTLLRELEKVPGLGVSGADGGIHFLLTCLRRTESELVSRAAAAGIGLRGLSEFCRDALPMPSTLVLGFGGLPTEQIPALIQALAQAWEIAPET